MLASGLALVLALSSSAPAQVPRSQLAGVSQNLAGTQIDIVYRRPSARGRELFGSLVPWDAVWTPSADTAARITVSEAIEVNGAKLAAGSYSLWAKPNAKEWQWIFNSDPSVFHLRHASQTDVLTIRSAPEPADFFETLTFYFSAADADSATLRMHWGKTAVPIRIKARPPR